MEYFGAIIVFLLLLGVPASGLVACFFGMVAALLKVIFGGGRGGE